MAEVILAYVALEVTSIQLKHARLGGVDGDEVNVGHHTALAQNSGGENLVDLGELRVVPTRLGAVLRSRKKELEQNRDTVS